MDCLGRRVRIERSKENQAGVKIVARTNLDRFLCRVAVAYEYNVVLKGADFDSTPRDALDHPGVLLLADGDHVADLKWPVCMQRNAGEKISQRVLQCEAY